MNFLGSAAVTAIGLSMNSTAHGICKPRQLIFQPQHFNLKRMIFFFEFGFFPLISRLEYIVFFFPAAVHFHQLKEKLCVNQFREFLDVRVRFSARTFDLHSDCPTRKPGRWTGRGRINIEHLKKNFRVRKVEQPLPSTFEIGQLLARKFFISQGSLSLVTQHIQIHYTAVALRIQSLRLALHIHSPIPVIPKNCRPITLESKPTFRQQMIAGQFKNNIATLRRKVSWCTTTFEDIHKSFIICNLYFDSR